jgi:hypothetical protein
MSARYTVTEMLPAVGALVQLRAGSGGELWIDCTVVDVKNSWGKNRLLVRPLAGDGQVWVELSSVRPAVASDKLAKMMSWQEV